MDAIITGPSPLVRLTPLRPVGTVTAISIDLYCSTSFTSSANKLRFRPPALTKQILRSSSVAPSVRRHTVRCGAINEISESDFQSVVLQSGRPVLVEFVATWCGPCRLISPAMESIAQEYGDRLVVVKIDHDANPRLIEEYKVYGLPTLILFKDGKEVPESRREGAITKLKLKEYLDALLETISVV